MTRKACTTDCPSFPIVAWGQRRWLPRSPGSAGALGASRTRCVKSQVSGDKVTAAPAPRERKRITSHTHSWVPREGTLASTWTAPPAENKGTKCGKHPAHAAHAQCLKCRWPVTSSATPYLLQHSIASWSRTCAQRRTTAALLIRAPLPQQRTHGWAQPPLADPWLVGPTGWAGVLPGSRGGRCEAGLHNSKPSRSPVISHSGRV